METGEGRSNHEPLRNVPLPVLKPGCVRGTEEGFHFHHFLNIHPKHSSDTSHTPPRDHTLCYHPTFTTTSSNPVKMDAIKQVSLPHRIDYLPLNSVSAPAYS